jgi:sugar O-acyltransferase (sialic acid O-acetyltransferase NeuD family)
MRPIILVGGGGHCISCIDVIEMSKLYKILGILDKPEKNGTTLLGYQVIGTDDDIPDLISECKDFLITVGQINSSAIRLQIFKNIKKAGGLLPVIRSPYSFISTHSRIDEGTIIMHHAVVNAGSEIGKCCIINSKALVEHETTVGKFCHISTGTIINGQSYVGDHSFIGSNTVVSNNISITGHTIIAAGSQVLRSIEQSGLYVGNPLKRIR